MEELLANRKRKRTASTRTTFKSILSTYRSTVGRWSPHELPNAPVPELMQHVNRLDQHSSLLEDLVEAGNLKSLKTCVAAGLKFEVGTNGKNKQFIHFLLSSEFVDYFISANAELRLSGHDNCLIKTEIRDMNLCPTKRLPRLLRLLGLVTNPNEAYDDGNNLFHIAVDAKVPLALLDKLLAIGVDINHKNEDFDTPLTRLVGSHISYYSSYKMEWEHTKNMVEWFIKNGSDLTVKNDDFGLVHLAYLFNNPEFATILREAGAPLQEETLELLNSLSLIKIWVERGFSPTKSRYFTRCISVKDIEIVQYLLSKGADPNVLSSSHNSSNEFFDGDTIQLVEEMFECPPDKI